MTTFVSGEVLALTLDQDDRITFVGSGSCVVTPTYGSGWTIRLDAPSVVIGPFNQNVTLSISCTRNGSYTSDNTNDVPTPVTATTVNGVTTLMANGQTVSVGGGGGLAWRPTTYFTVSAKYGGETGGVRSVTDFNSLVPHKVVRRAGRFRIWFSNGIPTNTVTAFNLSGYVQLPAKNGSAIQQIPLRFNGSATYPVPAGGGAFWCTDYITWPCEVNDVLYIKTYGTAGGAAFNMPLCGAVTGTISTTPAGAWESGKDNYGSDASAIAVGTTPWTSSAFQMNFFRPVMVETDCSEALRKPTVDFWGDSIGFGVTGTTLSFLEQIAGNAGVPFFSGCIQGTNQTQLPGNPGAAGAAYGRSFLARGDIAICEHGRNSANQGSLLLLWSYLRSLGYRKIIQTTTTNQVNAGNTAIAETSAPMRAFQFANLGIGDGPDVIWDVQGVSQDPVTGLWRNPLWSTDGLHPNDAGNNAIAAAGIAAGWPADLLS